MSLKVFRWASILLATVGLLLLYAMVHAREIPVIRVEDISQTMNFAYVRIVGRVTGDARVFRSGPRVEGMRFLVDDDTGVLSVRIRGPLAEKLEHEDRVPRAGDRVEVAGSLQVTADGVAMWIQDTDALRIDRERVERVPLSAVPWDAGQPVQVRARVSAIRPPPPDSRAPWEMILEAESDRAVMVVFDSVMQEIPERDRPERGVWIEARVTPGTHRGRPQLRLGRGADLRRVPEPDPIRPSREAEPVEAAVETAVVDAARLSDVERVAPGATIELVADVSTVQFPPAGSRAPWRVVLSDAGGAAVPLVFWGEVAERLGDRLPRPGDRIRIRARRDDYRDTVQLRLQRAEDLAILHREDSP